MINAIVKIAGSFIFSVIVGGLLGAELGGPEWKGIAFFVTTFVVFGIFLTAFRADEGAFEMSPSERRGCLILVLGVVALSVPAALLGGPIGFMTVSIGGLVLAGAIFGYVSLLGAVLEGRQKRTARPEPRRQPHEMPGAAFTFEPSRFFRDRYPEPAREGTLRLGYHPAPGGYSREEALRMFTLSGAGEHPGHTRAAEALVACCFAAMGREAGLSFLKEGARDTALPKRIGQLYKHAEQVALRGRTGGL